MRKEKGEFTYPYPRPSVTTDCVIFGYDGKDLKILLVERGIPPFKGMWALPGGFVDLRENLEDAAKRELMEETGVQNAPMIQLKTYGDYDRDPRWRVITTAYLAVLDADVPVKAGDDAADAVWFDVDFETLREDGKTYHLLTLRCEHERISSVCDHLSVFEIRKTFQFPSVEFHRQGKPVKL